MIRVVIYLVIVGLLALGAVWLADRRRRGDHLAGLADRDLGDGADGRGRGASRSSPSCCGRCCAPSALARRCSGCYLRTRRGVRGYLAVSQGLIAIGSGDVRAARKFADEAARIAPDEPLTLLLSAQAAQLSGDRAAAERTFHAMAARDDTRLLGLHGLFIEAQRREDSPRRGSMPRRRPQHAPAPAWAGHAVLEFRCAAGDWSGALERLDRNMKSGLIDRAPYRRQRAVLLTARALAAEDERPRRAQALALEAVKLAPDAGAGGGAGRPPARRRRRPAQGRAHRRGGVESQSASRSRRDLCASAARRFRARPAHARADAGREDARQCRRRAGGRARRARRAGICDRARARWRRSSSRRRSASRC